MSKSLSRNRRPVPIPKTAVHPADPLTHPAPTWANIAVVLVFVLPFVVAGIFLLVS